MEPDEQQDPKETINAVVITREFGPDGGVTTNIGIEGDVKPTEVETIIKLGLNGWRQRIGV